jgi:hypothetical protein
MSSGKTASNHVLISDFICLGIRLEKIMRTCRLWGRSRSEYLELTPNYSITIVSCFP